MRFPSVANFVVSPWEAGGVGPTRHCSRRSSKVRQANRTNTSLCSHLDLAMLYLYLRRSQRSASQLLALLILINSCLFITLVHHLLASADLATALTPFVQRMADQDDTRAHRRDASQSVLHSPSTAHSPCAPLDDACARYGSVRPALMHTTF